MGQFVLDFADIVQEVKPLRLKEFLQFQEIGRIHLDRALLDIRFRLLGISSGGGGVVLA